MQLIFRPKLSDIVAVFKADEEKWVRGLIYEIKNNEYKCALIDYGVTQTCYEVRKLPEKYVTVPEFACLCKTDANNLKQIEEVSKYFFKHCLSFVEYEFLEYGRNFMCSNSTRYFRVKNKRDKYYCQSGNMESC